MRVLLAALVVLATALAGCTAETPPEPVVRPPAGTPEPPLQNVTAPADDAAVEVTSFNGTAAGLTVPSVGALAPPGSDPGSTFEVKEGATAIVVEVAWESTDRLYLFVDPPCRDEDPVGADGCDAPDRDMDGQNPARVEVLDALFLNQTGAWSFAAYPEANAQGVPFVAAISVFYGALPDAGYTALPA